MKLGYQDAGAWTLLKPTPLARRKAAWLYAQFAVSKTVSLKKSFVGLTTSAIRHQLQGRHRGGGQIRRSGGVLSIARPREVDADGRQRAGLSEARAALVAEHRRRDPGDLTPQQAMDRLAKEMDEVMARLEQADMKDKVYGGCGPRLNPERMRERVARRAERSEAEARQREAEGSHDRLR